MAYCVASDVTSEFKRVDFSLANSAVTTAEVTEFISQADQFIDSKIGLKYEVPVTGANSLKILKQISIYLVAYRIKRILEVKVATPDPNAQDVQNQNLRQIALDMLKDIVDGLLLLSDATLASSGNGVGSYAYSNDQVAQFDRDTEQW